MEFYRGAFFIILYLHMRVDRVFWQSLKTVGSMGGEVEVTSIKIKVLYRRNYFSLFFLGFCMEKYYEL
jgi:hypothetical protein